MKLRGAPEPDPVVEAYEKDVDRTLLRENLRLTPEQRVMELMALLRAAEEFRKAGRAPRLRLRQPSCRMD